MLEAAPRGSSIDSAGGGGKAQELVRPPLLSLDFRVEEDPRAARSAAAERTTRGEAEETAEDPSESLDRYLELNLSAMQKTRGNKIEYRYLRKRWKRVMRCFDAVGGAAFRAGRWLGKKLGWEEGRKKKEDPKRILIVQLDHLGDAVLSTAMVSLLADRHPGARIDVLASREAAEVFQTSKHITKVWLNPRNRCARDGRKGLWRAIGWLTALVWWGIKLRKEQYDWVLDPRGEATHAALMWLTGARRRVGWEAGGGGFLLTDSADWEPKRHEVPSRLAMLERLGIFVEEPEVDARPTLEPRPEAMRRMARRLARETKPGEMVFVVHVGAGIESKRWPVQHWRTLARMLQANHRGRVILVGGSGEKEIGKRITVGVEGSKTLDWTGETTFEELAALSQMVDLFIGCDSGPAHVAAAAGAACVVLFSGTNHAEQWRPWSVRAKVVKQEVSCSPCGRATCPVAGHPCMNDLRPAMVLEAVQAALEDDALARELRAA